MALDQKQAFKFGFLLRCADEGLTPEQTQERIQYGLTKSAEIPGLGAAWKLIGVPGQLALLGLGTSAALGAGGGYTAAKLTEPDISADDVKRQELVAAYKLQADKARRATARTLYRQRKPAPRTPRFMS